MFAANGDLHEEGQGGALELVYALFPRPRGRRRQRAGNMSGGVDHGPGAYVEAQGVSD
jgi:ABC-type branched-subunit amino acid transport system ATPase component